MTNRNYYEKNNGYGYVVNVLKAEIGEDNTRFIIDNAVLRCNRLCGEYDNLPDKVKLHTHRMIFTRTALYIEMLEFIPCERAVELIETEQINKNKAVSSVISPDIQTYAKFRF